MFSPSLYSLFIDFNKGFKNVVIVGFSTPYHNPPKSKCCLLNLKETKVKLRWHTVCTTNLIVGGSSLIANQIGQIEALEER